MLHLVEDRGRRAPAVAGFEEVAGGAVRVAEVGEGLGFVEADPELAVQVERVQVAPDRLVDLAEPVMRVPEALPGRRLTVPVAAGVEDLQRLLTVYESLAVVAELAVLPADVVERGCLPDHVLGRLEQLQRAFGVPQRVGPLALLLHDPR